MEKPSVYAFPSDSDEFLPPTPPPVRLCQAFHSSSRSVTAPAPSANLASTRRSARQERGSKRGSASQPPPQLHYKDWTTPKLLKILFEKSIPISVGGDRMSLFLTYCEALSAELIFPPRLQASAVRPSSPATFSVPVPAAHTQDPALAAQLPLPAQSTQPQHLPQSLTPPIPSSSSAPQVTFNQLQTLLQPIIDSQLALSARLDKLENPALAPPAFSSSTPAYTLGGSGEASQAGHYMGDLINFLLIPDLSDHEKAKFEFHHGDYEKQFLHALSRKDKAGIVMNNPSQSLFLFIDRQHLQTPKNKATVFKLCSICLYLPQDQLTQWGVGSIEDHLHPYMPD
ncbi:UNVERIFIED_CONTAM: hypothetical protein FKN15_051243 [Acipenser sinensis]